ncbi:MAG: phage terminase large subunit [Patescibacteria group bacterium]
MRNDENKITKDVVDQILTDQPARKVITGQSHYWFFHLYFHEYVKYKTADFQKELFIITENDHLKLVVIVAFRGSGKSTIMTMSYPLWAVLGRQQKKCVVIISQTQQQVRTHFGNIKRVLESNELLKRDLGPFQEESDEWGSYSLVIPRFNARLVAASSEQSIRGIRHGAYRPDLIICDDVEDINSVKTKEGRDKTYDWFKGEIIPLGDKDTKILLIGNLLHNDSLLMRVRENVKEFSNNSVYREYPIMDEEKKILWAGKYQSMEEIESEKKLMGDDKAWQREFMLKIVADDDQIIQPQWIEYYDKLPEMTDDYSETITAVDLAISQKTSADCTAMVTAHVFGYQGSMRIYVLPNPLNKRISFPTTVEEIKNISNINYFNGMRSKIYIEQVAYQESIVQQLNKLDIDVEGFKVHGNDKRARINAISAMIRQGRVLFPRTGTEELIQQMIYFGVEKHDDLVDALSMLVLIALDRDVSGVELYPTGTIA